MHSNNKCFIGAQQKDPLIISIGDSHSGALNSSLNLLLREYDIGGITCNSAGYRPYIKFPRSDRLNSDNLAHKESLKF